MLHWVTTWLSPCTTITNVRLSQSRLALYRNVRLLTSSEIKNIERNKKYRRNLSSVGTYLIAQ